MPAFNENEFNFNKINDKEILFNVRLEQGTATVTFLINNSPLTKFHTLLVPRLKENRPQLLTRESMSFAIQLLHNLHDKHFRIGYNSPGALASVNHLHLHLLYIEQRLFIEDVVKWWQYIHCCRQAKLNCVIWQELHRLVKNIYRISEKYPSKGYCFLFNESTCDKEEILNDIAKLIEYFCATSLPHNIFCTNGNSNDGNVVKVFVFPRGNMAEVKEFSSFNVAFCELSGYIPTGSKLHSIFQLGWHHSWIHFSIFRYRKFWWYYREFDC